MEELRDRVLRYIRIEEEAMRKVRISVGKDSFLHTYAEDSLQMVKNYFSDAKYFLDQGDLLNSFAALNYSYGWLDSLVRLGVLDGDGDHVLFTNYK
jgi:hypothetical protein